MSLRKKEFRVKKSTKKKKKLEKNINKKTIAKRNEKSMLTITTTTNALMIHYASLSSTFILTYLRC